MYSMYVLLLLSIYTGMASAAASDTIFTQQERDDAHLFIVTTLDGLKVINQEKMYQTAQDQDTLGYFRWRSAFNALCDPAYDLTTWDEHDERQARVTYHNVLATPHWKSYRRHATSVERWALVYDYMHNENLQSLAYRLKADFNVVGPNNKEYARKFDTIMFLTAFLLNEQFKKIKKLHAEVQRKRDHAKMMSARELERIAARRSSAINAFSAINQDRQRMHEVKLAMPRVREKHHDALRRVVPKSSSSSIYAQPYPVQPVDNTASVKLTSTIRPGEGLLAAFYRTIVASVARVITDRG